MLTVTCVRYEHGAGLVAPHGSGQANEVFTQSILKKNFPSKDSFQLAAKTDIGSKWFNKCSWTCQICGKLYTTNSSSFFKHVTQDHRMAVDDYKETYGSTGFVFVDHKCKLCGKQVPCNGLAMCKHFKHTHGMSLQQYEAQHMTEDNGSSIGEFYQPTDEFWYNKVDRVTLIERAVK